MRLSRWPVIVTYLAFLLAAPLLLGSFHLNMLNFVGIYTLAVLGLTLLTGWTGLTSFGQAAFVGIGAYTSAWLTTTYGYSPWLGLALALLVTMVVAVALGVASLHLSGHYLPLTTLAWGMAIFLLFGNIEAFGRQSGINQVPSISLFGVVLDWMGGVFALVWVIVGVALLAADNLRTSRQGIAARILRSGRIMAESAGIEAFRVRIAVFVIASLLACVSGWLYAHMQRYVSPGPFSPLVGIEYLLMAVVGGLGSLVGALVGASLITLLKNYLQDILPFVTARAANLEIVVFGILFIAALHGARGGVMSLLPRMQRRTRSSNIPTAPSLASRQKPQPGTQILQVTNLTKMFDGLRAVSEVSFSLSAGEILGLIGPNGAGKTTLFNLVSGALKPSSGEIRLNGENVTTVPAYTLARLGIARTFQHVKLRPDMTVVENVMVGCYTRTEAGIVASALGLDRGERRRTTDEARWHLQRVGLLEKAEERSGNLSLGEQRMLEVARALAADPMLILLDEPAAGLRHLEKVALAKLLRQIRSDGCTVLLIEHDMSFVMGLVDRLVVLDFGTKIAEGQPAEIRTNEQVNRAYLGASR